MLPLRNAAGGDDESPWLTSRKGINPRTRQQQLFDLRRFHGISHYKNGSSSAIDCPGELLVEQHHSYYGEPWAGGRDVFDFLATSVSLQPGHRVLEIGCGTLRAGLHFIRFLELSHFFCLERDSLSLAAALLYELPANGLLHKRPFLIHGDDLQNTAALLDGPPFDLIYSSAVFLHMADAAVWKTVSVMAMRLAAPHGRLYVSHNIKFCTRLSGRVCGARLREAGLEYVGQQTHDSLLFNHFEVWFEFKRRSKQL
ncbi:uncharacterized protein [Physcomitrium patens]